MSASAERIPEAIVCKAIEWQMRLREHPDSHELHAQLQAWRLRDERWLIYRQPITDDNPSPKRGFYSFSMEAPR